MGNTIESRHELSEHYAAVHSNRIPNLMGFYSSAQTAGYSESQFYTHRRPSSPRDLIREATNPLTDICDYIVYRCKNFDNKNLHRANLANKLNNLIIKSYEKKLLEIFRSKQNSNETIFGKIIVKFSQSEISSHEFTHALVTAFCMSCFDEFNRLDYNLLKRRVKVLNLFIGQNEELELQALYAIQDFATELMHRMQQQNGIVFILYDLFYEEDIISDRVFISALDPSELNYMLSNSHKHSQKLQAIANESVKNHLARNQIVYQEPVYPFPENNNYIPERSNQKSALKPYVPNKENSDFIYKEKNNWLHPEVQYFANREDVTIHKLDERTEPKQQKSEINSTLKDSTASSTPRVVKEKESECPVCIETFSELKRNKTTLQSTICGHVLCKPCIDNLFKLSSKRTVNKKKIECPVCRRTLEQTSVHDLFI